MRPTPSTRRPPDRQAVPGCVHTHMAPRGPCRRANAARVRPLLLAGLGLAGANARTHAPQGAVRARLWRHVCLHWTCVCAEGRERGAGSANSHARARPRVLAAPCSQPLRWFVRPASSLARLPLPRPAATPSPGRRVSLPSSAPTRRQAAALELPTTNARTSPAAGGGCGQRVSRAGAPPPVCAGVPPTPRARAARSGAGTRPPATRAAEWQQLLQQETRTKKGAGALALPAPP